MKINKPNLKKFRVDYAEAVKSLEKEYGVKIEVKGITYDENSFRFKTTVKSTVSESGELIDTAKVEFEEWAWKFGLEASHYGKIVEAGGKTFKVCGIKPRSSKLPILGKDVNGGGVYKLSARDVLLSS